MKRNAAVGVSDHNGWAVFVTGAAQGTEPVVVDRRRVELIEEDLPKMPYEHETLELDSRRAEQLVKEVRESAEHCAERALSVLRSAVKEEIAALVLREPPLPGLPESVAAAHASSFIRVRADPMIYHTALCKAAEGLGIAVEWIARGKERPRAAEGLGIETETLDRWLSGLRASLGPPWQKDHQDAMARAVAGLGKFAKVKISSPSDGTRTR